MKRGKDQLVMVGVPDVRLCSGSIVRQGQKLAVLGFVVTALVVGGTVAAWLFNSSGEPARIARLPQPETPDNTPETKPRAPAEPSQETLFARELANAADEASRLKLLDSLAQRAWAKSNAEPLRDCMDRDSSAAVREKAFDVACALAEREGAAATTSVLKTAMRSPQSDVRVKSLRQCRTQPQPELIDELLSTARGGGAERYLAVHALSVIDEPRAQQGVLDAAKDESMPKAERARAIALLARSTLPAAIEYLKQLASAKDAEFSQLAIDTLAAIQKSSGSSK
jgi:hypothetical protein